MRSSPHFEVEIRTPLAESRSPREFGVMQGDARTPLAGAHRMRAQCSAGPDSATGLARTLESG